MRSLQQPGYPDIVARSLELFERGVARQLELAREACAAADLSALERAAHSIANSAYSVGAVAIGQLARELESRARQPLAGGCGERIEAIALQLPIAVATLRRL